jgi:hypothetical protein
MAGGSSATAAALLFAVLAPLAAAAGGSIFSNEGPTLVVTTSEWTLLMPIVSAKGSGKSGIFISGEQIYSFDTPANKASASRACEGARLSVGRRQQQVRELDAGDR